MDILPVEIVNEILLRVDRSSYYYASQVCNQWRQLSLKQVKDIKNVEDFKNVCRQGDQLSIIKSKYNSNWINQGLHGACKGGSKALAEFMITKGANNWNNGLYGDCRGDSKALAEFMITKGANNWNNGLYGDCRGGSKVLVEFIINKGATRCSCGKNISRH